MFTKGQKVTLITRWNNLGDFVYRDAIVYSCGKKRMVLTDELTGKEIGNNFNPNGNTYGSMTYDRLTVEETIEVATNLSNEFRVYEEARLRRCLTIDASAAYKAAIQKDLDTLLAHKPQMKLYSVALEEIKNRKK